MAGTGETYARSDGKFAFRLKAGNGEAVATDGGQGYEARASATSTLRNLMTGKYDAHEVYERSDGKFAFRIKASNGQVVATDGGEGYASAANAEATAVKINAGEYDGPVAEL